MNGYIGKFEFNVGGRVYGVPSDEDAFNDRKVYKASVIRLKTVVQRGVDRFLYVYHFGDDWRQDVIVEEVRDGAGDAEYPVFVDSAHPPEDVGGTPGFMEFLEAVLDPVHEEHARMTEWYGGPFAPKAGVSGRTIPSRRGKWGRKCQAMANRAARSGPAPRSMSCDPRTQQEVLRYPWQFLRRSTSSTLPLKSP